MARLLVVSDDGAVVVDIVTDDEDWTTARCRACGDEFTDRGHFRDTVQAAKQHADEQN